MASTHGGCFSLLSYLLFVTSLAQVCVGGSIIQDSNSAQKVSMDLYYESLSRFSALFISHDLQVIFKNGLTDIVDLKLHPWGNSTIKPDNSVHCPQGQFGCRINTIEACAIDAWPSLFEHFPFISCVEKGLFTTKKHWETCAKELGLDEELINNCLTSGHGKQLELKYATETASLQPFPIYVPWVVVDGLPLYEDYVNFVSYICKAYKGPSPSACADADYLLATF